jgi:hypothetical protein
MNRQEVIESAYRTGAVLTAAGVAFLGRIGVMPAMAMPEASTPNTPDHIQTANRQPKPSPEGVKVISTKSGQALENYQAYLKLKHRWNGVVILHAPKTDANVGLAHSPSAYDSFRTGYGFLYHDDPHAEEIDGPGIEIFKGRPYLAVAGNGAQWGWADLKWLEENKAVSFYAYDGVKPGPVAYDPAKGSTAGYPKVKYLEHAPEPNLPITATDLTGHMHNIHLNKAIPYASVNKLIK